MPDECYHSPEECAGELCCFHNPSAHKMNKWPLVIRFDRLGLTERICEHGIGHPDPDSIAWLQRLGFEDSGIHGCDGCCMEDSGIAPLPTRAEGDFNPGFTDAITQFTKYQHHQTRKKKQVQQLERLTDFVITLAWIAVIFCYMRYFNQS